MSVCRIAACEVIEARGHKNIRATHPTTFEITREDYLTPRGDCIIGVSANKAAADLREEFKHALRREDSILLGVLYIPGHNVYDLFVARGSSRLELSDTRRIIVRKSSFVNPPTLAIHSNKAAKDINRELIKLLRTEKTLLVLALIILQCSTPISAQ